MGAPITSSSHQWSGAAAVKRRASVALAQQSLDGLRVAATSGLE
jgi:hypothetical protein